MDTLELIFMLGIIWILLCLSFGISECQQMLERINENLQRIKKMLEEVKECR